MAQDSRIRLLMVLLSAAIGCGSEDTGGVQFGKVGGVVLHNESPVANARVTGFPGNGPLAVGATDDAGKFTLYSGSRAGAAVGKMRVAVTTADAASEPTNKVASEASTGSDPQSASGNMAAMGKYAEAQRKQKNEKKSASPLAKYADPNSSGLVYTINPGTNELKIELK